jgi:Domain of unknown function (DUF305)
VSNAKGGSGIKVIADLLIGSCSHRWFYAQRQFGILNQFLIENLARDRHVRASPGPGFRLPGASLGQPIQKDTGETHGRSRGKARARNGWLCPEMKMVLFSRAFIRKRMISLAATASVAATSFALAEDPTRTGHPREGLPIQYVANWSDHSEEQPFLSENAAAMKEMMADMTIKPTGDVDRDFVAMMVPHHQGAVNMARAELKYGHNAQLRRLAREIVTEQQQEITVMRDAVADGKSSAAQSPELPHAQLSTQSAPVDGSTAADGMNMQMSR